MLAVVPFDIHVSDTYFIVAHIHYVLFGGSVFTIFAGIYHWFPKMTGRMYDETLGKLHFWLSFIFFNLTFGPMHLVGIDGMPRRVADYAEQYATWNAIISVSAFIFGASFLIFLYNMIASWRHGPAAAGEPVAGALDRVAGVLAAADLQLRRDPDRGGRPVRVRHARRRARSVQGEGAGAGTRARRRRRGSAPGRMKRILVVANETAAGRPLIDAVKRRGRGRRGIRPRDLPPEPAEARLRDLRVDGARRRREQAEDDDRAPARGRHRGGRRGDGPRPLRGRDGRPRRPGLRRDHRVHPPRDALRAGCARASWTACGAPHGDRWSTWWWTSTASATT